MKEYTVRDIAELLGVSKPTVQRAIKAANIKADRIDGQKRYYYHDTAIAISAKVKPAFDFAVCSGLPQNEPEQTETPLQNAATDRNTSKNEPEQNETEPEHTETPPQNDTLELMRAMLNTIQEQLTAKDKQIAAYEAQIAYQNEQIKDYSERLKEAMELTKGQQYIVAADKTTELLTASQEQETCSINTSTTADTKNHFWKRLFKNKGEQ